MADEPKQFPRRRFVLKLSLGADDEAALLHELREIRLQIMHGHLRGECASGGHDSGYSLNLSEDPSITHESYFEAIKRLET